MADQNGQIGIFTFQILVAVPVHNRQIVVIILLRHKSARILAESTDFVLPWSWITDQLPFIENFIDHFHNLISALYPDTDVHGTRPVGNPVLFAHLFQPVRTAAAGSNHNLSGRQLLPAFLCDNAYAGAHVLFQNDILTLCSEQHLNTFVCQIILNVQIEFLRLLCSQMADRTVDQTQPCPDGTPADLVDLLSFIDAFHMLICPELQIDSVCVVDQLLCKLFPDQRRKLSAHFTGKAQLSVRKSACTGKTRCNHTVRLTVHAFSGLCLRTMPLIHRLSLFDHQDLLPGIFPDQFQRRKDSRRPCPDDNNVILHKNPSCPASYPAIISYLSGNGKQDCVFQTSAGFLQEYCPV